MKNQPDLRETRANESAAGPPEMMLMVSILAAEALFLNLMT